MSFENTVQKNWRQPSWLMLVVVIGLFLAGAAVLIVQSGLTTADTPDAPIVDGPTDSPRHLWEAQGIDDYRFTLQVSCFCIYEMVRPVTIEIRDGNVVSLTYVDDGTAADPQWFEPYSTAEHLFTIIEEAQAEDPVKLVTIYNMVGFPVSVDIDISELMADEELLLEVTSFQPLYE